MTLASKLFHKLASIFWAAAALISLIGGAAAAPQPVVPRTGGSAVLPPVSQTQIPLQDFVNAVRDGQSDEIRGVYASGVLALRVVRQPQGDPGFVSAIEGVATLFDQAEKTGTTGLLAHNYVSGGLFFDLKLGDLVQVIYGDGAVKAYRVTAIHGFQALQPKSPSSSFVDLQTAEKLSAAQLFQKMYTGSHHVTFQTCIQQGQEDSWGRLFVIAEPVSTN
jgi:hypothetical protein